MDLENTTEITAEASDTAAMEPPDDRPRWTSYATITTLIMAIMSAIGILLAGITLNEFFVEGAAEQIEVIELGVDHVNIEVLRTRLYIREVHGEAITDEDRAELEEYERDFEIRKAAAEHNEALAKAYLVEHELYAVGVTLLAVGISLTAISMIAHRRLIWGIGSVMGVGGLGFILAATIVWIT